MTPGNSTIHSTSATLWRQLEQLAESGRGDVTLECIKLLTEGPPLNSADRLRLRTECLVLMGMFTHQRTGMRAGQADSGEFNARVRALLKQWADTVAIATFDDSILAYLRGYIAQSVPHTSQKPALKLFMSYRRSDSADNAGRIRDRLTNRFGADSIFMDVYDIPIGHNFRAYIAGVLAQCRMHLIVIGPDWLEELNKRLLTGQEDLLREEVEISLRLNPNGVVPLYVRGAKMLKPEELPAEISKLAYQEGMAIRIDPDFDHDIERFITRLENQL